MKLLRDLFNKVFTEPVQKALKGAVRLGLIAGVSFIVVFATKQVTNMPETEGTIVLTFILRAIDKWLHEQGKATNNNTLTKGLTQF